MENYIINILAPRLRVAEEKRNKMYLDSKKIETIGYGHNLRDVPISDRAVEVIFEDDIEEAAKVVRYYYKNFDTLSDNRKAVLHELAFNMGNNLSTFFNTNRAINENRWEDAVRGFKNSQWYQDVHSIRADPLLKMLLEG